MSWCSSLLSTYILSSIILSSVISNLLRSSSHTHLRGPSSTCCAALGQSSVIGIWRKQSFVTVISEGVMLSTGCLLSGCGHLPFSLFFPLPFLAQEIPTEWKDCSIHWTVTRTLEGEMNGFQSSQVKNEGPGVRSLGSNPAFSLYLPNDA